MSDAQSSSSSVQGHFHGVSSRGIICVPLGDCSVRDSALVFHPASFVAYPGSLRIDLEQHSWKFEVPRPSIRVDPYRRSGLER